MRLLNEHEVRYLLVGGHAVGYHGHVRATADMDVWVAREPDNAARLVTVLERFGFASADLDPELFLEPDRGIRMGVPPIRIEIMTSISGVEFDDCYADRVEAEWDDLTMNIISLPKMKINKKASGLLKDLSDLEALG